VGFYRPAPAISSPKDEARRVRKSYPHGEFQSHRVIPELPIPQARARMSYQNPKRNRRNTAPPLWGFRISCYAAGEIRRLQKWESR
jgi:hypothetical protein